MGIVQLTHYKYNNNTFMKNLKITKMHRFGDKKYNSLKKKNTLPIKIR